MVPLARGGHPLIEILINHHNVQYQRMAKCLNPRQVKWALFFIRFDFKVSYIPGRNNAKVDALSCQFDLPTVYKEPIPILPSSCFLNSVSWDLEAALHTFHLDQLVPMNCLLNRQYVLDKHR